MTESIVIVDGRVRIASDRQLAWVRAWLRENGYDQVDWKTAVDAIQRNREVFQRSRDYLAVPGQWIKNHSELDRTYRGKRMTAFCATGAVSHFHVKVYGAKAVFPGATDLAKHRTLPHVVLAGWMMKHKEEIDFGYGSAVEGWNDEGKRKRDDVVRVFDRLTKEHERCTNILLAMGKDMPSLFPVERKDAE